MFLFKHAKKVKLSVSFCLVMIEAIAFVCKYNIIFTKDISKESFSLNFERLVPLKYLFVK